MSGVLRWSGRIYLALIMIYILGPALVVMFDSVNSATSFPSPFEHFTLYWYAALAERAEFLDAAWLSIQLAVAAAAIATISGFLAAYALMQLRPSRRDRIATLLMGPLLVPEIVMGLAILQLVGLAAVPLGLPVLVGTHAVFTMPLVVRLTLAGFAQFDFALEEAARSLGASRQLAVARVTLPLLRPSLTAGFVLALVLSFVNLPLSMFLTTPGGARHCR